MKYLLLGLIGLLFTSCAATKPGPPPRVTKVVLVHGFLDTGAIFKPMSRRLEKRGFDCYSPYLDPSDGRGGLARLAEGLKRDIDKKFGPDEPIQIVAFSMGGLVSRYYLQNLGGADRCEQLITISSPHHGTRAGFWYPSQGVKEMRPNSKLLTELVRTENRLGKMKVASFRTPMDLVILPASSSKWARADNREFPVALHPLMCTDEPVIKEVESRLLE